MVQRPYLKDRLIEDRPEGFVVIVPCDAEPPVPMGCTVCAHVMRTRDDETAYQEFGCCDRCSRLWAAPRRKAWAEGWRPTPGQVATAEADRAPLALAIQFD